MSDRLMSNLSINRQYILISQIVQGKFKSKETDLIKYGKGKFIRHRIENRLRGN